MVKMQFRVLHIAWMVMQAKFVPKKNISGLFLFHSKHTASVIGCTQQHRRLRFSSDADIVRLTNARIIIIIIIITICVIKASDNI